MTLLRRPVTRHGPLRVLFVVPDLHLGGAERHVVTLLPKMDRDRFAPSVVCLGEPGALFPVVQAAGLPATALGRRKREAPRALLELVAQMRRSRPDVVVTRGYSAEMLGRIAAVLTRAPRSAIWVHNCAGLVHRGPFRNLVDRLLEPLTSAYYGVARGQLPYLTDELGYPEHKVTVVYNGVDPTRFADPARPRDPAVAGPLGIGATDPVVGVLAVLRPEKDHDTLLRAARLVIDELPDARVLVVGDGPLRPALERLAAELGIADRIVFAGSRSDVPDLLTLMDVVALSSRSDCFPMALLEAMAAGRPIVATAVGGVPEIVVEGSTGHLVPPGDPAALAARLVPLLRDRSLARAMGRAARERASSEFSLDHSVRAAERAIEHTAGRSLVGPA